MLKIGYAALTDGRHQPLPLLDDCVEAEKVGFDSIWTGDHFHPWQHTNAACGFAWVWMTALAERTKRVEIGTCVTCPTLRYNPAIVAQAFATMRNMYPDRIFIGLGTGEAMNEVPVGYDWPPFHERAERLEESIKVIKLLWSGDFVSFKGKYYKLKKAKLYTNSSSPPPMYLAASGPRVAEIAGHYCDGLLVTPFPEAYYRNTLFPAMEKGARSANRDPDKIIKALEIWVAYDEDYEKALQSARFWAATPLSFIFKYGISDPREVEEYGSFVGNEQLAKFWLIGTKPEDHIKYLEKFIELGFKHIHVMSSSPDEIKTLRMYGKHVLPYIKSTYGA